MFRAAMAMSVLVVIVLTGAGCGGGATPPTSQAPLPVERYGDVISNEGASDLDPALQSATAWAQHFTYASRSGIDDSTAHVTGALFVPKGEAPAGGWTLVAFGHPATGTLPGCAPSLSPTLLGSAPVVETLLKAGYAVVMSDYQGLGPVDKIQDRTKRHPFHPYLDSTTAGYNVIDSVRAARALFAGALDTVSDRWLAIGIGQGGQAAWAANELAPNQGQGLTLLGAVAISPVADINGLADAADAGTLSVAQGLDLQAFLAALENEYGNDFNLDDFRDGIVTEKWDALLACQAPSLDERARIAAQITPDDLRPHTSAAAAALRGYLRKSSLPQGPTQAPMLVMYGGQDPAIPPAWTEQALDRACRMGDVIQIVRLPDDAPDPVDLAAALDWMGQRVNSVPAQNDCQGRTP